MVEPERIEAKIDTIYDLASLTKVLVTGLLCAKMLEIGEIDLGRTTDFYLPEFNTVEAFKGAWDTSIAELASHTTLLQAWKPFYLFVKDREEVLAEIVRTPINLAAGPPVVYSDLNFLVLMFLIERLAGRRIDFLASDMIFEPLGLSDTFFCPADEIRHRIAACEKGNAFEKQACIETGYLQPNAGGSDPFRKDTIWGEVHDGNAHFMGGVAGHAGLFSTVQEIFKIAQQFLPNSTTLLKPETVEIFRTNLTPGLNEHRSFAFQLASTPDSAAGTVISRESFGHLGFAGTSLWIDPVNERIFILLTNRTHNHELPFVNLNSVRRRFHNLANEFLDKNL